MVKNLDALGAILKGVKIDGKELTPQGLEEAIKGENEVSLEVSDKIQVVEGEGKFLTTSELEAFKTNIDTQGYAKGKTAGEEMFAKELKKEFGIEADGKDLKTVAKLVKDKIVTDAKIPEADKVKELTQSVENLQKSLQAKEAEFTEKETNWKTQLTEKEQAMTMQSLVGVEHLKPSHVMAAYKADGFGYQIDEQTGKRVLTENGKVKKDDLERPVIFDDHFKEWQTNTFKTNGSGRNGQSETGGTGGTKFNSLNDVYKHMEDNNIDPVGSEGEKLISDFKESQSVTA